MTTWLVTGASGFLGANAGLALRGRVNRIGMARGRAPAAAFDSRLSIDLLDGAAVVAAVEATRPDVILHCAALASHQQCERDPALALRLNRDAAGTMARVAESVGAYLVHVSTDAVFDGARGDYREFDATCPFSVYGETKLAGEHAVADAAPDALIVRTNFFGWSPSGSRSILEFFVNALRGGQDAQGYTDVVVTSIYAAHLISILERLAADRRAGIVHAAASNALSKFAFGQEVARTFGLSEALISPVSAAVADHATSRARDISLNTDLLSEWLGAPPPTQQAGIRQALADERTLGSELHTS